MKDILILGCILIAMISTICLGDTLDKALLEQHKAVFVDNVWSGASVGFAFATRGDKQYIAYYDADRWMTVACRALDSEEWQKVRLDNQVGWDSHNYVVFAFDSEGHMHLSGNMHCHPLRYYRTAKPGDITSLEPVNRMTGELESRVTYPHFYTGPNGEFLFTYRDGGSGNGNNIINVYDVKTKSWKRYINMPLLDGEGEMNAYQTGPARDRSGTFHMAWAWRDTPDCATNHDVSYARSPGSLENWQKSDGTPIQLPLTIKNTEILDRVQPGGGLLNSVRLSFDADDRPMVSYMKYDPRGRTQVYTMRLEDSRWKRYQTTDWKDRYEFSGGGAIGSKISFSGPSPWDEGLLYQTFTNQFLAPYTQIRFLDKAKLQPVGKPIRLYPPGFDVSEKGDEWQVNTAGLSLGQLKNGGSSWVLRWEAMRANRDQPREVIPPPSRLEIVELRIAD